MSLKLYYDLMSQPSRALFILLKHSKCSFEPVYIDLRKGEHFGAEFSAVNRLQRIPVIDVNGFVLTESVAIMRYLRDEKIIPESLYPKEAKLQARVEEFLNWQHVGLRLHCALYFRVQFVDPILTRKTPTPAQLKGYFSRMENALEDFDTKWLGRGTSFIIGDQPTVADLLACCEIEQPRMAGYDAREKFRNIAIWSKKVQDYFNPFYDEAHVILNKIAKNKTAQAKL